MFEFKSYHPIVNFVYFLFVIGFSMFFMHPVSLAISLCCPLLLLFLIKGRKEAVKSVIFMLPVMLIMGIMNPLFNHEGVTILTYLPTGNPLTLESVIYGVSTAAMLLGVLCWFSCFNEIMTGDKILYLFGRILPSLSLVFSMTLRFVPNFISRLKAINNAGKCIGKDASGGDFAKRIKNGLSVVSIMTTWSFENAIETADSMKSRGYGLYKRTSFSIFTFKKRDFAALCFILLLGMYTLLGSVFGGMYFRYFPSVKSVEVSLFSVTVFAAYFLLCIIPLIIEFSEVRKWNAIK